LVLGFHGQLSFILLSSFSCHGSRRHGGDVSAPGCGRRLEILAKGGNAADAAVATAAALNVTEPTSTGIGGDCFALFYDARTKQVSALNGSGRAPGCPHSGPSEKRPGIGSSRLFAALSRPHDHLSPGACAGWCDLVEHHGSLSMAEVLAPAILLAEAGFPVAPITAYFWQRGAEAQLRTSLNGRELTLDGRGPQGWGSFFAIPTWPGRSDCGRKGETGVLCGRDAEAIAATIQQTGGCLTVEDLVLNCVN